MRWSFSNCRRTFAEIVKPVTKKSYCVKEPEQLPWILREAFRYYRLSQASQDIFEAYRKLLLSLEALLNNVRPKLPRESERKWLKNALSVIAVKVPLANHTPVTIADPIDYFMKTQCADIRCRLFHAKYPDALLPHEEINPTDILVAYEALLRLPLRLVCVFHAFNSLFSH